MSSTKPRCTVPLVIVGMMGMSSLVMNVVGKKLRKRFNDRQIRAWDTANQYQLTHTAALAALVGMIQLARSDEARSYLHKGFYLILSGATGFSASIYALCLKCPNWIGPITPTGGLVLILGWISVVLSGLY